MNAQARDWSFFDRPQTQRQLVHVADGRASTELLVDGIHCGACALQIERALGALRGIERVNVNAVTRHAQISWQLARLPFSHILAAIANLGFEPRALGADADHERAVRERRTALKRLAVAGFAMMQVMTFALGLYAGALDGIEAQYLTYLRLVSMLVSLPVVLYSAVPFFESAWRDLRMRRLGMDLPVSLAIVLAFGASVYNTLRGAGEVYFDSVTMFVFFLLLGRMIEMHTRHRAGSVSEALARLLPESATRLQAGMTQSVAIAELEASDTVLVAAGAIVPADGIIIEGASRIDESMLTGEAAPIRRSVGEHVTGGSLNIAQPITVRLTAVGQCTVLAGIVRLLERAQTERPRLARASDRAAAHFIAWILLAAVVVAAAWSWLDPARAFPALLAVLVVTCPCALSLATPAAIAAATTRLARLGLLVTRADAIEALAHARYCLLDKTGTLTSGTPRVTRTHLLGTRTASACRELAALLEQGSEHPLAQAFIDAQTAHRATELRVHRGEGVEGRVAGERYRIGTPEFVARLAGSEAPQTIPAGAVCLGAAGAWLAAFELEDALRPDAAASIRALRALGLEVELASGDHAEVVARVAQRLGISRWHARLTPQDKVARVNALRGAGQAVLMVGDGINDAPVLGAATVSVAIGSGSALARASADLILTNASLPALAAAVTHARRTLRIVRQNLAWAALYNALAIPLAAMGSIPPWAAAIGMSVSSILVVCNAQRLTQAPHRSRERVARWLGGLTWPACCC
ncbi:MAG TPA: cation-translocating P-type ATPase [Steroidobacteraceae bacterium]|nr:cation-translocating P-type ATPase [Steroidobacteraceae bacterium]